MGKKKCPDCPECLPAWLAAFGDLMSLLLCFFVLLLSMSSMDAKKISEAIGSLSGAMSVLEGGTKTEISKRRIQESTPIESQDETTEAVNMIQQAVGDANEMMEKGKSAAITLEEAQEGFVIQLPASLLFKAGSSTIENEDALLFLKRVALIIGELPNNMEVSVQGHTDNSNPTKESPFKDNWELSSARAISVLQELLLDGVAPDRINAAGFAEFRPLATNATESGREKNRRVEIHFYGKKSDQEAKMKNSVLDRVVAQ
ncbi:MAG: OmpA family protein [Sulfurimonas sp.]|jgi:chemotaxis protein MotB|nr:OmpA family protein [Sulfurimonas sp.]MBU1216301.1 OmpA family protein [bacterium]MBU1434607.1 OmpA family protein [bacterium]MBU1502185.1 OmpA family protein [bacterium]MBU3939683.1 OmpA family protein [bacterium]